MICAVPSSCIPPVDAGSGLLAALQIYRAVKRFQRPTQLALLGTVAVDDPEAWRALEQVSQAAADDPNIFVHTSLTGVSSLEINAFQRVANVIVQRSRREDFDLAVSEALWKGRPVVAGRWPGIALQIPPPYEAFLVGDVEEGAARIMDLLADSEQRESYAQAGREHVRANFLLPRLVRDTLRLAKSLTTSR